MGHRRVSFSYTERNPKADTSGTYNFYAVCRVSSLMVILKDHKGFYLSAPFSHGRQSQINDEAFNSKNERDLSNKEGGCVRFVPHNVITLAAACKASRVFVNMKKKNEALELFDYGYEDTVIAARTQLPIEDVKELRRVWEKRNIY